MGLGSKKFMAGTFLVVMACMKTGSLKHKKEYN